MQNIFNRDFQDFIQALNHNKVEYLLIGGYSVIIHGYNRTTGDMDIWVNPTSENYKKLVLAFSQFGMPVFDMSEFKFLNTKEYDVFTFGVPPISIDVLTKVKGLTFKPAFDNGQWYAFEDDFKVFVLTKSDLIKTKKAVGRYKDLDDIEKIEGDA